MAALVPIATHLRAVLAAHVSFKLVGRRLRSPHDVERDGLVRVALKTADLEVAVAGVKGIAERWRRLRRALEAEHALIRRLDGGPVGVLARGLRALSRRPD